MLQEVENDTKGGARRKSGVKKYLLSQSTILSEVAGSISNIQETEEIERQNKTIKAQNFEKNDVLKKSTLKQHLIFCGTNKFFILFLK